MFALIDVRYSVSAPHRPSSVAIEEHIVYERCWAAGRNRGGIVVEDSMLSSFWSFWICQRSPSLLMVVMPMLDPDPYTPDLGPAAGIHGNLAFKG